MLFIYYYYNDCSCCLCYRCYFYCLPANMIYRRQHLCGVGNAVCVASSIQVFVTIRRKCYLLIIEQPYSTYLWCTQCIIFVFQMLKSTGQVSGNKGSMQQQAEEGQVHLSHVNVWQSGNWSVNEWMHTSKKVAITKHHWSKF